VAQFPSGGEIVLFDRSWYNRAMVEPVFGFCTDEEYRNFLKGVVGFEKDLVRQGTILVKLYFSVTKEEQARRVRAAPRRPVAAVEAQRDRRPGPGTLGRLHRGQVPHAAPHQHRRRPWTIVRLEDKHKARLNAIRAMLNAVPYLGRADDVDFVPDPEIVIPAAQELALMEADRIRSGKFTG
jgi:hypothetical protein